jgi:hypothetical protein
MLVSFGDKDSGLIKLTVFQIPPSPHLPYMHGSGMQIVFTPDLFHKKTGASCGDAGK